MTERAKRPAYQWYPGDFRRDVGVQSCSFEARGLWREMLDLMHDGEPYGHLAAGGHPIDAAQLARIVGVSAAKVHRWLSELEMRNVFSRTELGVIFSRRMVRDEYLRLVRAAGGASSLKNPAVPKPKDAKESTKDTLQRRRKDTLPPPLEGSLGGSPAVAVASASSGELPTSVAAVNWVTVLGDDWHRIRLGRAPYGQIGRNLKPLYDEYGLDRLRAAWLRFLESQKAQFGVRWFSENLGDFLSDAAATTAAANGKRWNAGEATFRNARAALGLDEPNGEGNAA